MKTSIIGAGKTGGEVLKLLARDEIANIFDIDNKVSVEKLKTSDSAIVFAPGGAIPEILPILIDSKVDVVFGSTGFEIPKNIFETVKKNNSRWIISSNFSMSMNIIRKCILLLGKLSQINKDNSFHIHEVHHAQKKDAPSGTAISWKKWLGEKVKCDITSERIGDEKGTHILEIKNSCETIILSHQAHSRSLFAYGAVWSARYLFFHNKKELKPGAYNFSDIFDGEFLC